MQDIFAISPNNLKSLVRNGVSSVQACQNVKTSQVKHCTQVTEKIHRFTVYFMAYGYLLEVSEISQKCLWTCAAMTTSNKSYTHFRWLIILKNIWSLLCSAAAAAAANGTAESLTRRICTQFETQTPSICLDRHISLYHSFSLSLSHSVKCTT